MKQLLVLLQVLGNNLDYKVVFHVFFLLCYV